jgi:hypothetical protein
LPPSFITFVKAKKKIMSDYYSSFIFVRGQQCLVTGQLRKNEKGEDPPMESFLLNVSMVSAIIKGTPIPKHGHAFEIGDTYYTNIIIDR